MKTILKNFAFILLTSLVLFSCRKEEIEIITLPTEEVLAANSEMADLLLRTSTNDGSYDNIIDGASCFNIKLPVTVIANDIEVVIETEDDLNIVETIFDEFTDDVDSLEIIFPVVIIMDDYTEVTINNQSELNAAAFQCPSQSSGDDDIECIDIQYPITASIFDQYSELLETITINSDQELFAFLLTIDGSTIVTFNFPITVILIDGTTMQVDDFDEFQAVILSVVDTCDEDDDNDPNDDDCNNCTTQQLEDLLVGCENWMVDKLERNNNDLEDTYIGYSFNFFEGGTLTVNYTGTTSNGTWSSSGEGNNINVNITIPDLPDFNDDWNLHEITQIPTENKVDLRIGEDRLRFESDCTTGGGGINDGDLITALTNGDWYVNYFFDDVDETIDFTDFTFNFATDNTGTATNSSGTTNGVWSTSIGDETELELNLNFGATNPLDEIAEDWDVLEVTNDIIRLKDVSGGDGSVDFLTFSREPFTGGGGNTLSDFLDDGNWMVASYLDDGDDETSDYAGYTLDFTASNGTVIATNGSNTNNGTWQELSSGNKLLLDFGVELPFEEFNDDWDVLSANETQITLQDVSGGGGGTDTLILEKI